MVKESTAHNDQTGNPILYLRDSHIGMSGLTKKHDIARADSPSLSKRFLTTTNVPINITATMNFTGGISGSPVAMQQFLLS